MSLRLVSIALLSAILAAPATAVATPLHVACAPERPVIGYGEHVVVTAVADAPPGTPSKVEWSADGGTLTAGPGPASTTWMPGGPTGEDFALFTIRARLVVSTETAECTARIAVIDRITRGGNENLVPTRTFLEPDAQEAPGYGLYTYILFAERPATDKERELIEAVLRFYLTLPDRDKLEKYQVPPAQLNATYIPIARPLPDDFIQREDQDQVAWIRNNYDYERAVALLIRLRSLPCVNKAMLDRKAWMVSGQHPLSPEGDPCQVLPLELSAVPTRLIPDVMHTVVSQIMQPRQYNRLSVIRLGLDVRILIGQLGDGLQLVTAAFELLGAG
jgi:hypothetical protein